MEDLLGKILPEEPPAESLLPLRLPEAVEVLAAAAAAWVVATTPDSPSPGLLESPDCSSFVGPAEEEVVEADEMWPGTARVAGEPLESPPWLQKTERRGLVFIS